MKKLFLVVLAAGLFFACNNDKTNDQAEAETTDQEQVTEDQPAVTETAPVQEQAPVAENTPAPKAGTTVDADKDGAKVETEGVSVEANKDGNVSLQINTKGKNSKGNR